MEQAIADLLNQNADDAIPAVLGLGIRDCMEALQFEAANKNRTTVVAAINDRIDALQATITEGGNADGGEELEALRGALDEANTKAQQEAERADQAETAMADANTKAQQEAERADQAEAALADKGDTETSAKEERGAEIKEHLKPGYEGMLTVPMAQERNAYMKAQKSAEKKSK